MRLRFFLGLAAVAAIAIGSVIGALFVRANEDRAFERRQNDEALRAARQAEAAAARSIGQLATAVAFYQAVDDLTEHKFKLMAESLLDSGALSGTGLILAVPASRRAEYQAGHGPIRDRAALGFRRAGRRPEYFPLAFAASRTALQPPLGYDVGNDPARAGYLLRSRDSGRPVATRVMHLTIGGTGINVFQPVFRDGARLATLRQRRSALQGFAVGAFSVRALATAAGSALDGDVKLQILEDGRTVSGSPLPPADSSSARLRIADRTWLLLLRDPSRPGIGLPLLIAVFGLSMAALLGALVLVWSRNERMQELRRQASQDWLTGLKNRRRFEEDLRGELARSGREGSEGAVLMLDLDHFKQVNDTLGHRAGDRVIAEIAAVLRGRMRETDVVARLGGDEFALVLPSCDAGEAAAVAAEIAAAVREHVPEAPGVPAITASIGVAMFGPPPHGRDYERVLHDADAAMYEAKQSGRDTVRVSAASEAVAQPQDAAGRDRE